MTREEAIEFVKEAFIAWESEYRVPHEDWTETYKARDMAIEALQTEVVRCKDCKYQNECEEVVLFEVTDDEVIGHRVHWCSYGRSK